MTASVKTSGSQTATVTTEHTLATVTDAGTYQLAVDVANLAGGDSVTLKIYGKARSSDTEREVYSATFAQPQTNNLKISIPVVSPHHLKATLKQTTGTGRAFPWAIYEL